MKVNFYIEANGKKIPVKNAEDAVKESLKANGKKIKDIKSVSMYYKVDESNCYYVTDDGYEGCAHIDVK